MPRPFPIPSFEHLLQQVAGLMDELRTALHLPGDMEKKLVTGPTAPPANLVRLVGNLPASEDWHESGPGGLAMHSMRVACRAVQLHKKRFPEPADGEELVKWQRRHYGIYLAALIHDIGKVWFLDVDIAGEKWPIHRYLCDWAKDMVTAHPQAREMGLSFRPRTRSGPTGHEPLALFNLTRVVPPGLVPILGWQNANDLLASLTFTLGASPHDQAFALVHEADHQATGEEREHRKPKVATPRPGAAPYQVGSAAIADDFVHGFRRVVAKDSRVKINTVADGHLLLSASHTILWISTNQSLNIFRLVYEVLAQEAASNNLGGFIRSYYQQGNPHGVIDELGTRVTKSGAPWCIPAGGTDQAPIIRHHLVVSDQVGRKQRKGYGIIIANDVLWGDTDLSQHGMFTGRVGCFIEATKEPACDADEIGFMPLVENERGSRPAGQRATSTISGSGEGVLDLETVTSALVREIAGLLPVAGDTSQQQAWASLLVQASDRLPSTGVVPALELCLDRLRHLTATRSSTRSGSLPPPALAVAAGPEAKTRPVAAAASARSHGAVTSTTQTVEPDDLSALVAGLIVAVRTAPVQPLQEPFHGYRNADGSVIIPWPQGLDGILAVHQVLAARERGASIAAALGVDFGQVKVPSIAYSTNRPHHRAFIVPASWKPRGPVPDIMAELVVLG